MAYFVISVLLLGLALSVVEIFVPGFGFFGIAGILCITVSAAFTVMYFPFGLAIVTAEFLIIGVIVWKLIKWAKAKQLYGRLILKDILSYEKRAAANLETLIGKEGVTDVALRPFGSVLFNGVKTDAYSEGPFIPKGRTVTVVNVENDKIIVREMN